MCVCVMDGIEESGLLQLKKHAWTFPNYLCAAILFSMNVRWTEPTADISDDYDIINFASNLLLIDDFKLFIA